MGAGFGGQGANRVESMVIREGLELLSSCWYSKKEVFDEQCFLDELYRK